jgi:hypothetical protein
MTTTRSGVYSTNSTLVRRAPVATQTMKDKTTTTSRFGTLPLHQSGIEEKSNSSRSKRPPMQEAI